MWKKAQNMWPKSTGFVVKRFVTEFRAAKKILFNQQAEDWNIERTATRAASAKTTVEHLTRPLVSLVLRETSLLLPERTRQDAAGSSPQQPERSRQHEPRRSVAPVPGLVAAVRGHGSYVSGSTADRFAFGVVLQRFRVEQPAEHERQGVVQRPLAASCLQHRRRDRVGQAAFLLGFV